MRTAPAAGTYCVCRWRPVKSAPVCTNSGSCLLWLSQKRRQERGRPPWGRNSWRHLIEKVKKKSNLKVVQWLFTEKKRILPYLGLSCPPSMYICQNLMYPSWLAVANTVPSGDRAPSLTRCSGRRERDAQSGLWGEVLKSQNATGFYFVI